jgi:hypothetical protein
MDKFYVFEEVSPGEAQMRHARRSIRVVGIQKFWGSQTRERELHVTVEMEP